jgi:hypothetical protein
VDTIAPDRPTKQSCPKCGFDRAIERESCACCGVIFAKVRVAEEAPPRWSPAPTPGPAPDHGEDDPPRLSSYDLWLLGGGLVAALLAYAFPLTRFLLSVFVTLLHEFGHALVAWGLGCPAVPAFDFMYGGGVTYHHAFNVPVAVFVGLGLVATGWWLRRRPRAVVALGVVGVLWLAIVVSEWRRGLAISSAGHVAEMIFAGIFLWMALSGRGWRRPEVERPLGAFLSLFVALHTLAFASRLRDDAAFLADYMGGKGGAMMNDLEHVALDLRIWLGMETTVPELAGWMLVLVPVPIIGAFALHVLRRSAWDGVVWLFEER